LGDELTPLVECYSGGEYAERPLAVRWMGERLAVEEVERAWRSPTGKCFWVRTGDGRRFELAYDEQNDAWQATPAGRR